MDPQAAGGLLLRCRLTRSAVPNCVGGLFDWDRKEPRQRYLGPLGPHWGQFNSRHQAKAAGCPGGKEITRQRLQREAS